MDDETYVNKEIEDIYLVYDDTMDLDEEETKEEETVKVTSG